MAEQIVTLPGGERIRIRPVTPDDPPAAAVGVRALQRAVAPDVDVTRSDHEELEICVELPVSEVGRVVVGAHSPEVVEHHQL